MFQAEMFHTFDVEFLCMFVFIEHVFEILHEQSGIDDMSIIDFGKLAREGALDRVSRDIDVIDMLSEQLKLFLLIDFVIRF